MTLSLIYAAIAALGYSTAAVLSKKALHYGAGVLRLSFVLNLVFAVVFVVALRGDWAGIPVASLYQPVLCGALFFIAQIFTFAAIRMGDVSLQTPVMGTKAVFVVLFALILGTEQITVWLVLAAILSMLAVALLGFSGGKAEHVGLTIGLSLLSALFFAGSDTVVANFARDFGAREFLIITMLVNALLSLTLIPYFNASLREIPRKAWRWILWASLLMALQAVLLNYTIARFQNVSSINIIYSSRGLWSVLLAVPLAILFSLPREGISRRILFQRLVGAILLSVAIVLVFSG